MVMFPAALPEIPYGGFSPVRLQASGTRKFSAEPSGLAERLKSNPDIHCPAIRLSWPSDRPRPRGTSASKCGAWVSGHPPAPWGPRSGWVIVSQPSTLTWPHPPVWRPSATSQQSWL